MSEGGMSHLDEQGRARMVDVSEKAETVRTAVAEALVVLPNDLRDRFLSGDLPKGDGPAVVRIAGISGAKRTSDLIPLCHPIPIDSVEVDLNPVGRGIQVIATVRSTARTGVEMEAMTAVSTAALALYDMVKGMERAVEIETVRLLRKEGGRSGLWERT